MKSILVSLYGLFAITAIITHLWTVVIAVTESGVFAGLLTLVLPVLSELFWMIKMFGSNNLYAFIALIHLILALPMAGLDRG